MLPCSAALLLAATLPASALAQGARTAEPRVDAGWIVSKLARPAPMRTSFVEVRTSRMLKAPLRLSGEYLRPDARTLVRQVRTPYAETTTIVSTGAGPGQATIERGGKRRTYSLSRVPELASLQSSFGALLGGDRATLERDFRLVPGGTRADWTMALVPRDPGVAARLKQITLHGRGAELRCIETVPAKAGEVQRTLLATAARAAGAQADVAAFAALCRGDRAP
jgi:hypothetical protein